MSVRHSRVVGLLLVIGVGLVAAEPPPVGKTYADLRLAPGFAAEVVWQAGAAKERYSWTGITVDEQGALILADEKDGIFRLLPPPAGERGRLERLPVTVGGAQGLLARGGDLWVMANPDRPGLRRITGSAQGQADRTPQLALQGRGEHGPHSVIADPDGQHLLLVIGNHTRLPTIAGSQLPTNWAEDLPVGRIWDPSGHARGILAPGGFILRTDLNGGDARVVAIGLRNPFDLALDALGERFTFDADMEWDMGLPWYRPTRIYQVVSGADFGWRSGSGKWSSDYEDSVPATVDLGPGSPTGMVFGTGAAFPVAYQRALYALDWTFGTVAAIHLSPAGAGFSARVEEFLSASGFPVTDAVVGRDGALYLCTGGRGTAGVVLRVTYRGTEATTAAPVPAPTPEQVQRRRLEAFHGNLDPQALATAWPFLGHPDRLLRYAARLAIEAQPVATWADRALAERDPQSSLIALMALARQGGAERRAATIAALGRIPFTGLSQQQAVTWLRDHALVLTRMGEPTAAERAELIARLDPLLPCGQADLDAQLVELLATLDAPTVVGKALRLIAAAPVPTAPDWSARIGRNPHYGRAIAAMIANMPPAEAIRLAFTIRGVRAGWTYADRQAYAAFLTTAQARPGGRSYRGYLSQILADAEAACPEAERTALRPAPKPAAPTAPAAEIRMPQGPGQAWTVETALAALASTKPGNAARGKDFYQAVACAACHRFGGTGSNVGPDLTSAASKFNRRDLLVAIIDPSHDVSDQYQASLVTKKDGTVLVGRTTVDVESADQTGPVTVYPFAVDAQAITVPRAEIAKIEPSAESPMPAGLVNAMSATELADLIAYLVASNQ